MFLRAPARGRTFEATGNVPFEKIPHFGVLPGASANILTFLFEDVEPRATLLIVRADLGEDFAFIP